MSTSLIIDTSTDRTLVAILSDGILQFEAHHDDALGHGEVLPKLVQEALAKPSQIDSVIVGMGPGPFTGLRVGISFAQSFAFARAIPWIGVCGLDAIASEISAAEFFVAIDARRKEVFYGRYLNGARIGEPAVCQPSQLTKWNLPIYGEATGEYPSALGLAKVAMNNSTYRSPIYVRRPDAYPAPTGVKFRQMLQPDLVTAFALEKSVYKSEAWTMAQFKEEFAAKDRIYVVAEYSGEVIAYAGAVNLAGTCDVLTLTVAEEHRKKGIGREMLRRLIDWARTQKCEVIMLEVRVGNEEAMPLYESFGFIKISRRADYYGPGKTAIVMRKELQ
jgi:tRNA threonylcarbamoyl adenosine modification protein YeaZ